MNLIIQRLFISLAILCLAVLLSAPWLDERLVWCGWLAVAGMLVLTSATRGWAGETAILVVSILALALAFHWAPAVLAYAMNTRKAYGFLFTVPIVLWDAIRLAAPFWLVSRLKLSAAEAWLPAGLLAAITESIAPAVFPWKLGYSQAAWLPLVQSVDLFGPEFSTFMLFAHAGVVAWLMQTMLTQCGVSAGAIRPQAARWAGLALAVCTVNLAYGCGAIALWKARAATADTIEIVLVQANPEEPGGIDALRRLTTCACAGRAVPPALVCWPECSGGCYDAKLDSLADEEHIARMSRGPNGGIQPLDAPTCSLLFGGKVFHGHREKPRALYQSAILVDSRNTILGRYHKRHLMPFGEYVPGEEIYPAIKRYFPMQEELTEGSETTVLDAGNGARVGVMLCYEDMISSAARSLVGQSATILVSLINGAAFTEPLTLRQHRLLAQLRAVELRRSFLRCAATGETCTITAWGEVQQRLPLFEQATLQTRVAVIDRRTLYSLTGRIFPLGAALLLLGHLVALRQHHSGDQFNVGDVFLLLHLRPRSGGDANPLQVHRPDAP